MATCDVDYNALPHINQLIRNGVRSVERNLKQLPGTMWSLKHKHFDIDKDEIILFEVAPDVMTTKVIKRKDLKGLYPCQAVYEDGHWKVVGVTSTKCNLTIPDLPGSGMVTAILKKDRLIENTDEKKRIQMYRKMTDAEEDNAVNSSMLLTGYGDNALMLCIFCKVDIEEHFTTDI